MIVGTITKEQQFKADRKLRRESDLDNGFKGTHKVHKSDKSYTRKTKHKAQW